MFRPNQQLGSYFLIRRLGRGAFGEVWLAEERTALTVHKVALKFPNFEDINLDMIRQEATVWETVKGHPNILPIIKADIVDDQIYIASEYATDGSLDEWLKNHDGKAPTIESAVEMTRGILAGLAHLHSREIIHRDLKPSNILLQSDMPRLADFGLARVLKSSASSSNVSGTYAYMPPEAFDGIRSKQTDIWSAGVICYQLLSGTLPFPQPEMTAMIAAILMGQPKPLPDNVPDELKTIVMKALRKQTERWQSAIEMRDALAKYSHSPRAVYPPTVSYELPNKAWPRPADPDEITVIQPRPARNSGEVPTELIKFPANAANVPPARPFAGAAAQPSPPVTPTPGSSPTIWVGAGIVGGILILAIVTGIILSIAGLGGAGGSNNPSSPSPRPANTGSLSSSGAKSTPTPTPTPEPPFDIPSINARVTELKFYEEGKENLASTERVYQSTFDSEETRFICYELNLAHPSSAPQKQNFSVQNLWYKEDTLINTTTLDSYVDATEMNSSYSKCYGAATYGNWKAADYRLDIKYGGKVIASEEFTVE